MKVGATHSWVISVLKSGSSLSWLTTHWTANNIGSIINQVYEGFPVSDITKPIVGGSRDFQGWLRNFIVFPFIFKMQITLVSQKNHSVKNTFRINKCRRGKERQIRVVNSCFQDIRFITKAQPRKIAFFTRFLRRIQLYNFDVSQIESTTRLCLLLLKRPALWLLFSSQQLFLKYLVVMIIEWLGGESAAT